MDAEHFGVDAEDLGGLLDFGTSALGQRATGHGPMSDVAVGYRNKFHMVSFCCPQGGCSAAANVGVVWMGVGTDDLLFTRYRRG